MSYNASSIKSNFQKDGFAVVRSFLDQQEISQLDQEIARYINEVLPSVPRIHKVYESGWSGPLKHFSRLELYDNFFQQFLSRPATLKLVESCLGHSVEPITSEVFYKPAGVGTPAALHQDNAYFNCLPPYGLVVWIALDEVTLQNGAIHFTRGSHRLGNLLHDQTGNPLFGRALATPPDPQQYPEIPALLKPGDATLHHFLTAHRSGPNQTDRNRRGFVLDYKAFDAAYDTQAQAEQQAYKERVYKDSDAM